MGILSRNNMHFVCVKVIDINGLRPTLKKMLVCCLPTQKIRGGLVGRLFFLIVEVGRSVGFFFFYI